MDSQIEICSCCEIEELKSDDTICDFCLDFITSIDFSDDENEIEDQDDAMSTNK